MKKDKSALIHEYFSSVQTIKKLFEIANQEEYTSLIREGIAKLIAVKFRVLLIDTSSQSLFSQLKSRDKFLFEPICTRIAEYAGNLLPIYSLVSCVGEDGKFICKAVYSENKTELRCSLDCWLNEIVIDTKLEIIPKVSRKDIILTLSDKEGGAHFDPLIDKQYYETVYNSGYVMVNQNGQETKIQNNYYIESFLAMVSEFINAVTEHDSMLMGASFVETKNDLSIVRLLYEERRNDRIISRYKFFHNQNEGLPKSMLIHYDYSATANYHLLFTKNYTFEKNGVTFSRRVITTDNCFDLLFFMDHGELKVFVKDKKQYARITENKDIYNLENCKHYSKNQAIREYKDKDIDFLMNYLRNQNFDITAIRTLFPKESKE